MNGVRPGFSVTLAIHPNSHGFGWMAFEGVLAPHNWGTVRVRDGENKNAVCIARAERLLGRFKAATLVLEEAEHHRSKRAHRIKKLVRGLTAMALSRGVEVATYPFNRVQEFFAMVGATTREDIAEVLARQFEMIRRRLPRRRRPWDAESEVLAIFSACALLVTHGMNT